MEYENIEMLRDTLEIFQRGSRRLPEGGDAPTTLTLEEVSEAQVLLPGELSALRETRGEAPAAPGSGRCDFRCARMDSFAMARRRAQDLGYACHPEGFQDIWVLNFANAVHPGGGVRHGATAQEEDLCRTSSLLLSLESEAAGEYYRYNRGIGGDLGSSAVVLGAFGCSAFGNDPEMVAELFRASLLALRCDGKGLGDLFREIDFAVLDNSRDRRNFNAFHNRFTNEAFYGEN